MHRFRIRAFAIAAALALVAAGCGTSTPTAVPATATPGAVQPTSTPAATASVRTGTPSASGGSAAEEQVYAQIESQVEAIRGLQPTRTLVPTLLDEQGVREYMTRAFDEQVDPKALAATESIYKHLGLLPASASLKQLEIDIQSSQVVGFYDAETRQLYLVSKNGRVGAVQKATFSHEFTHALQDQNYDLQKLLPQSSDQGDRDLARTALVEGDATLSMTYWAQKGLSLLDLAALAAAGTGPQADQLNSAPAVLRKTLLFPYEQGLAFVQHVYAAGGWNAVDRVYANLPASTSQILHPELYDQHVAPIAVTLPPTPAGFQLVSQDTAGEFLLGLWLGQGKNSSAAQAAEGWAGDRLGLYESADGGWAVVIETAWRGGAGGGAAFESAAANAPHQPGSVIRACGAGGQIVVVVASDAAAAARFGCGS